MRYILTQKRNYGLGQGHSASPSRGREKNEEHSDPALEKAAWGPAPRLAAGTRKALTLLVAIQLKTKSRTVGDPKGAPPAGQPRFIYCYLENAKLKTKVWSKVLFCFVFLS